VPRIPSLATGGLEYHVLNRCIGRFLLFEKPADYRASEKILREGHSTLRSASASCWYWFRRTRRCSFQSEP